MILTSKNVKTILTEKKKEKKKIKQMLGFYKNLMEVLKENKGKSIT